MTNKIRRGYASGNYSVKPNRKSTLSPKKEASEIKALAVGSVFPSFHFAIADWRIPVHFANSIWLKLCSDLNSFKFSLTCMCMFYDIITIITNLSQKRLDKSYKTCYNNSRENLWKWYLYKNRCHERLQVI